MPRPLQSRPLARPAAENAIPTITSAPFVNALQREAQAREARRERRRRLLKFAASAAAVAVVLHLSVTQFFFTAPTEEALDAHAARAGELVLPLYSSVDQPLQIDAVAPVFRDRVDRAH